MSNLLRLFMRCFLTIGLLLCLTSCYTTMTTDLTDPFLSIADKNYITLQQALPVYENAVAHPWATIMSNGTLRPGTKDIAVMALRGRLKATGDLLFEDDRGLTLYDISVTEAVKHFQSRHGLKRDGVVGAHTLYELNIPPEERLKQIQVNMERWAKLSSQLRNDYILVNVPAYRLDLVSNGQRVLTMRAIVGKPARPTPEISSTITRIVFNPYWNVPKIIANQDIIPKVLQNPQYLDTQHIRILDQPSNDAAEISPEDIDWNAVRTDGFQYHFRQDPGTDNALGLVKFEFQNTDDIYMHDTPAKNLFDMEKRAYSSGCIRLEKPFSLISYLMSGDPTWNVEKAMGIFQTGLPKYVKVANPTQVVITYVTTWVDDGGNIQFRDDIYGLDDTIY